MKVAIISANGGMFDAYKVFNIATAAAATDGEVSIKKNYINRKGEFIIKF